MRQNPPERGDLDRFRCDECIRADKHLRWMASVDSEDFAGAPFDQRLRELALGYLESAKLLCIAIGEAPDEMTWPRASVVYFVSHLAAELFLKACVVRSAPAGEKLDHDVERLQERFREQYPSIEPLSTPWDISIDTITGAFGLTRAAVEIEDFEHKPDQVYRYGADKVGRTMRTHHNFAPGKWLQWIERAEIEFDRIWSAITR